MTNKKHETYQELFDMMEKESDIAFVHRNITLMGDYEFALMTFFEPCVTIKLCYFHTTQNIYRKAQSLCAEEYNKRTSFFKCARSLMMLPYVPIDRIDSVFELIKERYQSDNEISLVEYFETYYLNGNYDRNQWNVVDSAVNTNNSLESFHSSINRFIRIKNPSFHLFVDYLNQIIMKMKVKYEEVVVKHNEPRSKNKLILKNKHLLNVIINERRYNDNELLESLMIYKKEEKNCIEENNEESNNGKINNYFGEENEEELVMNVNECPEEDQNKMEEDFLDQEENVTTSKERRKRNEKEKKPRKNGMTKAQKSLQKKKDKRRVLICTQLRKLRK